MEIKLKRSSVLEGGVAKEPTVGQLDYGELAVNYNENDPALFIKDSSNQIIRITSSGHIDGGSAVSNFGGAPAAIDGGNA